MRQKKFRQETGLFAVEGTKLVEEALHSSFEVESVYRKEDIGEHTMQRISSMSSPSPILALVRQKNLSLSDIPLQKGRLYLALDGLRDPGNLGTIIRIAEWFGVSAVFCSHDTVELYNPKTVQATMGALFRLSVVYCNLRNLFSKAGSLDVPVWGTFLDGTPVTSDKQALKEMGRGSVIVLGNESEGISDPVSKLIGRKNHILIPSFRTDGAPKDSQRFQGSESLNVATACAAILSLVRATGSV